MGFQQRFQQVGWELRLAKLWSTECQAKELGLYLLENGGSHQKSFHWESDTWSTEFRENLFVCSPTEGGISRQATWQRQSENKETSNKATTPHNTTIGGLGLQSTFPWSSKSKAKDVQTELESGRNDHPFPNSQEVQPLYSTFLVHFAPFPNICGFPNYTFDSHLPPKDCKDSEGESLAYFIHAIPCP